MRVSWQSCPVLRFRIELEFGNVGFVDGGKPENLWKKNHGARTRINSKFTHAPTVRFDPWPQRWGRVPSLLARPYCLSTNTHLSIFFFCGRKRRRRLSCAATCMPPTFHKSSVFPEMFENLKCTECKYGFMTVLSLLFSHHVCTSANKAEYL